MYKLASVSIDVAIDELQKIAHKYNCQLYLPPFYGRNNFFFIVDDIKQDCITFRKFLMDISKLGFKHAFHKNNDVTYMEIMVEL